MTFGEKLRRQLVIFNITQAELAKQIYRKRAIVNMWVNGKREPKISDVLAICGVLRITPNELLQVFDDRPYRLRERIEYLERENEELGRHIDEEKSIINKLVLKLAEVENGQPT